MESDVNTVTVDTTITPWNPGATTNFGTWTAPTTTSIWYSGNTIYMYQVRCPKRSCRTFNWMPLDIITPCKKCSAKLKAVAEQAEFEIEVG